MTQPLTYTIDQAAQRIGPAVTVDWLKKAAAANKIPHTRSGKGRGRAGRIAFTEEHLTEILRQLEQRPGDTPDPGHPSGEFGSVVSRGRRPA